MDAREIEMKILQFLSSIEGMPGLAFYTRKTQEGDVTVHFDLKVSAENDISTLDNVYGGIKALFMQTLKKAQDVLYDAETKFDDMIYDADIAQ